MTFSEFDQEFALSMQEFSAKREDLQAHFAAFKYNKPNDFAQKLAWWDRFLVALAWAIDQEEANFYEYPNEYFLTLEEVSHYRHWQLQLDHGQSVSRFIHEQLEEHYGI